jgi:N-acyl-D-aspartate/D-glutamate deacylase
MVGTLEIVEDMNAATLREGVPWESFETYPDYLDAVSARGVRLNFCGYVGHTAVRLYVMGDDAFDRAATDDELAEMAAIVGEAVRAGAIGFSSSSNPTHRGAGGRPVPSRAADLDELLALVEPLRDQGRGVVSLLAGERIAYGDVFTVQRRAGRPLTWTPMLVMPGFDHAGWLGRNSAARADDHDVWAQTAVRPIVFQENLRNPFTLVRYPAFAELSGLDVDGRRAAYSDADWRARAAAEVSESTRAMNWEAMTVAESKGAPQLAGRPILELAEERGTTPFATMLDVALEDDLTTRFNVAVANREPDEVETILRSEGVLLGLADSGAHVGQLCDACFATDLLATWTRERGVFTVEEAVHKLTGEPAAFLGLRDRGTIAAGHAADICVFDPATVAPGGLRRVRDFPADGERLVADAPVGVRHVLVNGVPIRRDGADVDADARPGRVLRG